MSESSPAGSATLPPHDGRLVGEDVVFVTAGGHWWDELAGMRGECVLYDFYDELYTVLLIRNGRIRRVQVAPEGLQKAAGTQSL